MRLLVTGAGGLLGGRLALLLSASHAVVAARHASPPPAGLASEDLDLTSEASLERALDRARPEAVVHAAALADVDRCEADPELAERLNVLASAALARRCQQLGLRLLLVSTDLVFDGSGGPWREWDAPSPPRLVYARSKLAGERVALEECPEAAVVRVALVHGRGYGARATASESVAWGLRAGRTVRLFSDQYRTPVDPESVAAALERLLSRSVGGLFHVAGAERVSRYQLGLRTASALGLSPASIQALRQSEQPIGAPRPADCSLDVSRARRLLGWAPRPLDEALRESRLAPAP